MYIINTTITILLRRFNHTQIAQNVLRIILNMLKTFLDIFLGYLNILKLPQNILDVVM